MRLFLWTNLSHVAAILVAASFWGVFRLTAATGDLYAKSPRLARLAWGLWAAVLLGCVYLLPGFGLFAATLAVTFLADNHYWASLASSVGTAVFHERITELIRSGGVGAFLSATVPSRLLHFTLAVLLLSLTAGPPEWFYWVALGLVLGHGLSLLSTVAFAFKYRESNVPHA